MSFKVLLHLHYCFPDFNYVAALFAVHHTSPEIEMAQKDLFRKLDARIMLGLTCRSPINFSLWTSASLQCVTSRNSLYAFVCCALPYFACIRVCDFGVLSHCHILSQAVTNVHAFRSINS